MLDFESLSSGKPVPAADASDMKRVWELTSEAPRRESAAPGSASWDIGLIASQCGHGADPLAVSFRVALLRALLRGGLLDEWRDGDRPYDVVFRVLATFPLPEGIQGLRSDEFAAALRRAM
ncbi:MAG: hypothetical protein WB579_23580 [Bryobacteraceae bacterium]